MNDSKPWYQSKIIWLNVGTAVVLIIGLLTTSMGADGKPLLPLEWTPYLALAANIISIILRGGSTQSIKPLN